MPACTFCNKHYYGPDDDHQCKEKKKAFADVDIESFEAAPDNSKPAPKAKQTPNSKPSVSTESTNTNKKGDGAGAKKKRSKGQSYDKTASERATRWKEQNREAHRQYMREYMRRYRKGIRRE